LSSLRTQKVLGIALLAVFLATVITGDIHSISAYGPQTGDNFHYSETIIVNNGAGSYYGYTDQSQITGMEQVTSVSGSNVSTSYNYSYQYSNNAGSSTSSSSSGNFAWSSSNYTYTAGTDNQVGYSEPIYVWFAMNASLPVGGTFHVLNTLFKVLSKSYSILLTSENKSVLTIQTEGSGKYQRSDSYGVFNASYIWYEYFDPSTGYIIAYSYVEQDNGQYQGSQGSFTYTDNLYVTSTSYTLAPGGSPSCFFCTSTSTVNTGTFGLAPYLGYIIALVVIIFFIAIGAYLATRRKGKLPEHPYPSYTPPPGPAQTPWQSGTDLGSKPPEQVVVRDVAKVNCKYCGTLIPTTVDHCPYCGAPRT
jgi:hypothetical protein